MTFHADSITTDQQAVLHTLGPTVTDHGFYLGGGGTAIALQLGHRRSIDFDWFTSERFDDSMRWAQTLREAGVDFTTSSIDRGTLHGTVDGVRVSFLEYRYALLQPLIRWPSYHMDIAALDDLACMKLSAIAQWGAKKDFIDLYGLVRAHRPLPALITRYQQKYSTDDIAHLLYALAYFDDAESERMPVMLWDVDWATIKDEIQDWVKQIAQ